MPHTTIWDILGIVPTRDKKSLQQAYHKQLLINNPEDNPQGFMQLREAYENALAQLEEKQEPLEQSLIPELDIYFNAQALSNYHADYDYQFSGNKKTDKQSTDYFNQLIAHLFRYMQILGEEAAIKKLKWINKTSLLTNIDIKDYFQTSLIFYCFNIDYKPFNFLNAAYELFCWQHLLTIQHQEKQPAIFALVNAIRLYRELEPKRLPEKNKNHFWTIYQILFHHNPDIEQIIKQAKKLKPVYKEITKLDNLYPMSFAYLLNEAQTELISAIFKKHIPSSGFGIYPIIFFVLLLKICHSSYQSEAASPSSQESYTGPTIIKNTGFMSLISLAQIMSTSKNE